MGGEEDGSMKRKREDDDVSEMSSEHHAEKKEKVDEKGNEQVVEKWQPPTIKTPLSGLKVVYFHDPELAVFEHSRDHKFRPFRAKLAHYLLCSYGYYPDLMEPLHPRLATRTDLGQFHSDSYLELLGTAQRLANKRFSWASSGTKLDKEDGESEEEISEKVEQVFKKFNLVLDQRKAPGAVFPGVLDYCRMYTTGSLGCAARLCSSDANVAINWYGGMSHARSSSAQNGCFVNDTVLAILELLQRFPRVMYINLSGIHTDAVEQAFYSTNRVLYLSFHSKVKPEEPEFPGTGDVLDVGMEDGEGYTVNIPLDPGVDDAAFIPMFRSIVGKARTVYNPDAVVLQCGSGLLAGERDGQFSLSCKGYGECTRVVRDFTLPLLMLGGVGSNMSNTARLWAYLTAVVLGMDSSLPEVVPEASTDYREYFGPTYETLTPRVEVPKNLNSPKTIPNLRRKIMNNLDKLKK